LAIYCFCLKFEISNFLIQTKFLNLIKNKEYIKNHNRQKIY
jgi:hypothetical protein